MQARRFSEQLDDAINRSTNRALTTAEIIAELVKLAKQMRATLKKIAVHVVWAAQQSVTNDWSVKESLRAAIGVKIRRLLTNDDDPPDQEDKAVKLVLEQAGGVCRRGTVNHHCG